jgi:hypothetical protein
MNDQFGRKLLLGFFSCNLSLEPKTCKTGEALVEGLAGGDEAGNYIRVFEMMELVGTTAWACAAVDGTLMSVVTLIKTLDVRKR